MKADLLRFFLLAAALLGSSTVHANTQADEWCAPLLVFAKSMASGEQRSIRFDTSWGRNFKDEPGESIYAKRCRHEGFEPAKQLCTYLLAHGSAESAQSNLKHVLACLAPNSRLDKSVDVAQVKLKLDLDDPDTTAALEFGPDVVGGGMTMSITISKLKLERGEP